MPSKEGATGPQSRPRVVLAKAAQASAADRPNDSLRTVLIAFVANLGVAIAKTIAAIITGSASMVAEASHSWADTGNEVFLLVADKRGSRGPDSERPLGYGRESYLWSTLAAVGLFVAGAAVSIWNGVTSLFGSSIARTLRRLEREQRNQQRCSGRSSDSRRTGRGRSGQHRPRRAAFDVTARNQPVMFR